MQGASVIFRRLDGESSDVNDNNYKFDMGRKKKRDLISSSPLFRAAKENDVRVLDKLIRQGHNLDERGPFGQHALHIALLHDSNDVALRLMDTEPLLINSPVMSKVYLGETALHIAIMNHNFLMVKELVRRGADVVTPRANGKFFNKDAKCGLYYGEYVLSFAAGTGQVEVFRFLHQNGAALDAQDSYGNTALHLLATVTDTDMAKRMYDLILSLDTQNKYDLEKIPNHQGLSAIKYTAYLGNYELFKHIMQRRREVHWSYGPITSALYNIEQIDSYQEKKNVLEMITLSPNRKEAFKLLKLSPVKELLEHKWKYLQPWFILFGAIYLLYIIIFTLSSYYRPSRNGLFNKTTHASSFEDFYQTPTDYWRLAGEIISVLGALLMLFKSIPTLIHEKLQFFTSPGPGPLRLVNWCFCFLVLILVVLRLLNIDGETEVMAVALVLGWVFITYYGRAFERLGPFNIMIQKMLFRDILQFFIVYLAVLIGFTGAFIMLFKDSPNRPEQYNEFGTTMQALIKLTVGLENLERLEQSTHPGVAVTLYLFYLLVSFVLLFNLLIAMMSSTYDKVRQTEKELWKLQRARLTLELEMILPHCAHQWRSGVPGSKLGRPSENWYMRCEEKSEDPRRVVRCYSSAPDPNDQEGLSESQETMWNNQAFELGDVSVPHSTSSTPPGIRAKSQGNGDPLAQYSRAQSPIQTTFQPYNRALSPTHRSYAQTVHARMSSPSQAIYDADFLRAISPNPNHELYLDNVHGIHELQPSRAKSPNVRSTTPSSRPLVTPDPTLANVTTEL